MLLTRKQAWFGGFFGLAVIGSGVLAVILGGRPSRSTEASESPVASFAEEPPSNEAEQIPVKTIRPKRDPSFTISDQELAYVKAYFKADLRAQVAGPVKFIAKDIGDPVTKGELLVEINVPALDQEVAQEQTLIEQRRQDVEVAKRKEAIAEAAVGVASSNVEQKEKEVAQAAATCDFRGKRWTRFKELARSQAVVESVVEEEERDYLAAQAACEAAKSAVQKAAADLEEAKANLDAAKADVRLKQTIVEVARKARDLAQAQADYAKITAPFDSVITQRNVDPGSFVQNATTARTEPLLTLARTDIVTVYTEIPDNFAPLVTKNIDAIITMKDLPGVVFKGKVTRFSHYVGSKARRMRVEVDLYNDSTQKYRKFVLKSLATLLAPVGISRPEEAAVLTVAGRLAWEQHRKGSDTFPLLPQVSGEGAWLQAPRLIPGMVGYMELRLPSDNLYLAPSGAVFSRGGERYILQVKDGIAHLVNVEVLAEDGKLSKIVKIVRQMNPKTGVKERVRMPLSGNEEIIASGQGEIGDGQAVKATLVDW